MRSFAVWYEPSNRYKNDADEPRDFININFWSQVHQQKDICYFDFGVYVDNIDIAKSIFVYCPFKIDKKDITDLGHRLNDTRLVNALFNEIYDITKGKAKRKLIDCKKPGTKKFIIYDLQEDNDIEVEYCKRLPSVNCDSFLDSNKGTIITLNVSDMSLKAEDDLKAYKSYYFRFRIKVDKKSLSMISQKVGNESLLADSFVSTDIMDFRINDIRSCCDEVRERFNINKHFNLRSIHYLVMRNADDKVIVQGKECISRLLEKDVWEAYIENLEQNVIAYHFKEKATQQNSVDNLCVLVRFQNRKANKEVYTRYAIIAVALSMLCDFIKLILKIILEFIHSKFGDSLF